MDIIQEPIAMMNISIFPRHWNAFRILEERHLDDNNGSVIVEVTELGIDDPKAQIILLEIVKGFLIDNYANVAVIDDKRYCVRNSAYHADTEKYGHSYVSYHLGPMK